MLAPVFTKLIAISCSIYLLSLVSYDPMPIALAAQSVNSNNNNTDPIIKAIQEASSTNSKYLKAKATVKDFELDVVVPITSELMSKGLAIKNQMKENEAMLFVFKEPSKHSFWMKDMKFPIDIMWLDNNGKIVHIEENLEPCPLVLVCPSYTPNADSQYVLETVAGFTQKNNINVGTDVDLELVK
jgi:uncharacterized membrane protein (UPF0127 family)